MQVCITSQYLLDIDLIAPLIKHILLLRLSSAACLYAFTCCLEQVQLMLQLRILYEALKLSSRNFAIFRSYGVEEGNETYFLQD